MYWILLTIKALTWNTELKFLCLFQSCRRFQKKSCRRDLLILLSLASLSRWEINSMYYIWQTQIHLKKGQWTLPYQGTLSWDDRGIVIKGIPPRPHQEIPCTAHSVLLVWDFFIASHGSIIWDYRVHKHAFWQDPVR